MSELEIRPATPADIPSILDTLRLALGESPLLRRTRSLWNWKHVENPFGESLVLVATAGDAIAGVRALMRWEMETPDGDKVTCMRAVDTATHPDHLRKGVFRKLTESAIEMAAGQGVDLIFNTPNEKSAPGYLKMGWKTVSPIGVQVRPVFGRVASVAADEPPTLARLGPDIGAMDITEHPDRDPTALRTRRNQPYLRWRFNGHPTADYGWVGDQLGAGIVVRASHRGGRPELVISDILGKPDHRLFRRLARSARTRYLAGWFSPSNPERRTAIRGGLIPVPGLKTLQLVARPLRDLPIDVFDLRSWDIATSDLELL